MSHLEHNARRSTAYRPVDLRTVLDPALLALSIGFLASFLLGVIG
ncbi:MAG TPA: hypothetical protein VGX71_06400 [Pseudaminobacter sp.]|nr:hypothetical protein [Pseudaminobacter sp.]